MEAVFLAPDGAIEKHGKIVNAFPNAFTIDAQKKLMNVLFCCSQAWLYGIL